MARKRTLLLVFIHGFKGGDDTFGLFPEHLQQTLQKFLPNISVKAVVYPRYETRGNLPAAVKRFREWLQDLVLDTEDLNGNRSLIDPSVRVVLLAHSMGGIVAADTLLSILDDEPIRKKPTSPSSSSSSSRSGSLDPRKRRDSSAKPSSSSGKRHDVLNDERMMFPAIIGICAFDTPYLGLSPSMFANSAENNFRVASDAFTTVSSIAKTLGFFGSQGAAPAASVATSSSGAQAAALPAAGQAASSGGGWGWGKLALAAAAATTVTAGAGTAVYMNRSNITQGFSWVTSHLEFVGVLFNSEELKQRIMRASSVPGMGIANFYTVLGKGAKSVSTTQGKTVEVGGGGLRTFCSLPPKPKSGSTSPSSSNGKAPAPAGSAAASSDNRGTADIDVGSRDLRTWWFPQLNDKAADEVSAHMYMFTQATNPAYKQMLDGAGKQVMRWSINWYDSRV
ncbi:uncharacterized protein DFL_004827 [Arthrobotrys flagrans]|uniref:DUF676 domain-containing protein n=1 Tax=Arthrobotrys flagrans TaxID=97331 RepID=A0A437A5W1_ARTFL|nr:hypothetical protein DFL_004827 [Arthrobotrys flagrans]